MNIFHKIGGGGWLFLLLLACNPPGTEKPKGWSVRTLAGGEDGFAEGKGAKAKFNKPSAIAISDNEQSLYIADTGNHRIRKIDIATGEVTTLAGSGTSGGTGGTLANAQFNSPRSIAAQGSKLYVADNNTGIREIDIAGERVTTLSTTGAALGGKKSLAITGSKLYVLNNRSPGSILEIDIDMVTKVATTLVGGSGGLGPKDGIGDKALFNGPESMSISSDGTSLVVADDGNSTRAIRSVDIAAKTVGTLGKLDAASGMPTGSAADPKIGVASGIYIADSKNSRIKRLKLAISGGAIVSQIVDFAGNSKEESKDGPLQQANFSRPEVIAVNSSGTKIFVIDNAIEGTNYTHHRVRMIEYK